MDAAKFIWIIRKMRILRRQPVSSESCRRQLSLNHRDGNLTRDGSISAEQIHEQDGDG
jgi:hypothetical protein